MVPKRGIVRVAGIGRVGQVGKCATGTTAERYIGGGVTAIGAVRWLGMGMFMVAVWYSGKWYSEREKYVKRW